ncbi:hypothetical protein Tco_0104404 [Tanacetum coccineum]
MVALFGYRRFPSEKGRKVFAIPSPCVALEGRSKGLHHNSMPYTPIMFLGATSLGLHQPAWIFQGPEATLLVSTLRKKISNRNLVSGSTSNNESVGLLVGNGTPPVGTKTSPGDIVVPPEGIWMLPGPCLKLPVEKCLRKNHEEILSRPHTSSLDVSLGSDS